MVHRDEFVGVTRGWLGFNVPVDLSDLGDVPLFRRVSLLGRVATAAPTFGEVRYDLDFVHGADQISGAFAFKCCRLVGTQAVALMNVGQAQYPSRCWL